MISGMLPTGVVSQSVCGLTSRTVMEAPMYRPSLDDDRPHAGSDTPVARAGPPTPPAIVVMTPAPTSGWSARPPGCEEASAWPPAMAVAATRAIVEAVTAIRRPAPALPALPALDHAMACH